MNSRHLDVLARTLAEKTADVNAEERQRTSQEGGTRTGRFPAVRPTEQIELAAAPVDIAETLRQDSQRVYEQVAAIQASERAARAELVEARARIEQYQRAEHTMTMRVEALTLDIEVEKRRTEKVREAFTALRVRVEGVGRLVTDALVELREDDAS